MSRTHGRIYSHMWDDSDVQSLSWAAHGMYGFLLSQSDLNQAGLIALRSKKWARASGGSTEEEVEDLLRELEELRFIVVDWDTQEVLIRTFIRNDKVYKQPNVMLAARADSREISSKRLRAVMVQELKKVPVEEVSDTLNAKSGTSPREVVEEAIRGIIEHFGEDLPDPWATPGEPYANPSDNPSGGHNARVSPSPTPTPTKGSAPTERATSDAAAPKGSSRNKASPNEPDIPGDVTRAVHEHANGMIKFIAVRSVVERAIKAGHKPEAIRQAMCDLYDRKKPITLETVGQELAHPGPLPPPRRQTWHDDKGNPKPEDIPAIENDPWLTPLPEEVPQ